MQEIIRNSLPRHDFFVFFNSYLAFARMIITYLAFAQLLLSNFRNSKKRPEGRFFRLST